MQAASDAIYPGSHLNTLCPGNNFSVRMILTITEEGTAQIHFCMVEQTVMFIVYESIFQHGSNVDGPVYHHTVTKEVHTVNLPKLICAQTRPPETPAPCCGAEPG